MDPDLDLAGKMDCPDLGLAAEDNPAVVESGIAMAEAGIEVVAAMVEVVAAAGVVLVRPMVEAAIDMGWGWMAAVDCSELVLAVLLCLRQIS